MDARARPSGRGAALDVAILVALKAAIGVAVLHAGFTHVSDDDYARVVIAEAFAHAPKLDPSGTSWLPFPFWLNGAAMAALGRSLDVARGVAFALGTLSVAAPYAAMRAVGCARVTAVLAIVFAMATPWSAWLGVATVPEAMTTCLIVAGAIAVTSPRARPWAAAALLAASLSRYEAWPACAVFALACVVGPRAVIGIGRVGVRTQVVSVALAILGPLAWMAWNAHAHGSAFHFLARVAAYRQSIGAVPSSLGAKLATFPLAVVMASPAIVGCAALGSPALVVDERIRARWAWPLLSALAILAFLVVGDVRDGAPTHHPERAVVPIAWLLAAFAIDALSVLGRRIAGARPSREGLMVSVFSLAALAWSATLPARWADHPATSDAELREPQIARGLALEASRPAHIVVTPCAYEHFALLAAFGAPERADVAAATHEPVTPRCPLVEPR